MAGPADEARRVMTGPSQSLPVLADPNPAASLAGQHADQGRGPRARRCPAAALVLIAGAMLPAWIAGTTAPNPRTRDIHRLAVQFPIAASAQPAHA
jgi:hypothetical protein